MPSKAISLSVEAKFVVAFAVALAVCIWWLLSEREPTQKEMTFAYRKYIVAINEDRSSKVLVDLRQRVHEIELIKQRCDKLDDGRYRCTATVLMDDHPVEERHPAANAMYSRDANGWRFDAITDD